MCDFFYDEAVQSEIVLGFQGFIEQKNGKHSIKRTLVNCLLQIYDSGLLDPQHLNIDDLLLSISDDVSFFPLKLDKW